MKFDFQQQITHGKFTLGISILIYILGFVFLRNDITDIEGGILWDIFKNSFPLLSKSRWTTLAIHLITIYLILELDAVFALNRVRTTFHISVFLILLTVCPFIFNIGPYSITSILILISLFPLFYSYQDKNSSIRIFYAGLFFSIGIMFAPQLVWLFPVYFISIGYISALNNKTFVSWIWGMTLPFIFLASCCYYFDYSELFIITISEIFDVEKINYSYIKTPELINIFTITFLIIISFCHQFYTSYLDKIKTRIYLYIISWIEFALLLILILIPGKAIEILSATTPFVSIMIAHLFCYSDSKSSRIFFIFTLIILIGLLIFNFYNIYA